jgi:FkbM family methyltransferase
MRLINTDYINTKDKNLTYQFIQSTTTKKYILGVNSFTKSVVKHIKTDGTIDDFTRVQSSRNKNLLHIDDICKDSIILITSMGSPLEVINTLKTKGYTYLHYFSFYKYSKLELKQPPFMCDFANDFKHNQKKYLQTYNLLQDGISKDIFTKIINFKISFDISFMEGFTNNFTKQYFDKDILPDIHNITFIDGGAYVGDTIPNIIKNYPDYKKIYCIEPNTLHLNIAKRDFENRPNIEFINCGLSNKQTTNDENNTLQNNCKHDYQALNTNTIDNLIKDKIDFIKLDIEGAEQDALKGAKNIILKHHPILTICIYHKAQDWYKVPQIVLEIRDDYKIYLRHYMEGIYETVIYFIPVGKK